MHTSRRAFPRSARLLASADFRYVFEKAWKSADSCFTVLARSNTGTTARLGLVVAKKQVRRAVDRNKLKRIIRESFRQHQELLEGLDLVVLVRSTALKKDNPYLFTTLNTHWNRLADIRDKAVSESDGPTTQ